MYFFFHLKLLTFQIAEFLFTLRMPDDMVPLSGPSGGEKFNDNVKWRETLGLYKGPGAGGCCNLVVVWQWSTLQRQPEKTKVNVVCFCLYVSPTLSFCFSFVWISFFVIVSNYQKGITCSLFVKVLVFCAVCLIIAFVLDCKSNIFNWATPWENVSSRVSDQARDKLACAATKAS